MKKLVLLFSLLLSTAAFGSDPFSKAVHKCIATEMIKQYPIYNRVIIADFITFAINEKNIDYMILLQNPETNRIDSRSFIIIREGKFSSSKLYMTEGSNPSSLNLGNCF